MISHLLLGSILGHAARAVEEWRPSLLEEEANRRRLLAGIMAGLARAVAPTVAPAALCPFIATGTGLDRDACERAASWAEREAPVASELVALAQECLSYEERLEILNGVFDVVRALPAVPRAMGDIGAGLGISRPDYLAARSR